ncbi:MAG: sugar phosphate nucleotidyltransferase, partial [Pseudomonadota bacterium]
MSSAKITPVILCGGSGTRLWPLSRKSYPKQFVPLVGETSLYQQSVQRLSGEGFERPIVVTNSDFRFIVTQQLSEVGLEPGHVLIEPLARNTAPALLAAALVQAKTDANALLLAAPSDHYIQDTDTFRQSVANGIAAAETGQIVTFGITPTRPETGYGYLALGEPQETGAIALNRFVEKPELPAAQQMLEEGGYLWNGGIFLYAAQTLI